MNSTAKILVPDREWLITDNNKKIGGITKNKKGYVFYHKGKTLGFKDINDLKAELGIALFEEGIKKAKGDSTDNKTYNIYDYPCSSKPYEPVYSVKEKLPLYAKSSKSKSKYCAGHYIIKFRKGWVKSFCPKLITLQRYPYHGPFKTEMEIKTLLNNIKS